MGYDIRQEDASFGMTADNFPGFLETIVEMCDEDIWMSWISLSHLKALATDETQLVSTRVRNCFRELRWEIEVDQDEDIVDIQFIGQKMGSDEHWMQKIARFVTPGSYIQMRGEDGAQWRYQFENGEFKTSYPAVVWT